MVYRIRIEGHLDDQWADWFSGLAVTLEENGSTLLTGPVVDQAALFGLLKKVRDLGMPLVSLHHVESGKPDIEKRRNEMNGKMQLTVDPDGKWIYRTGGIATFILVIGWFATFPLYASTGIPPVGVEARLLFYAPHMTEWWIILGLMVFTDLLYLGIALALYQALKRVDQSMMLLAVAFKALFVVLDLAVLWTNYAALFNLSTLYMAAASEAQRAAIVGAAASPSAVLDSILPSIYSILVPSLGTLFASLVMLKGVLSKSAGYLGLAVVVTGIIAVADPYLGAWGKVHIVNALLATVWFLIVGFKLYKLSQETN